jgi:16S rRNA (guanine1207-N2)-methyltransferase
VSRKIADPVLQTLREALVRQPAVDTLIWGRGLGAISRELNVEVNVHTLLQDARESIASIGPSSFGVLAPSVSFERIVTRLPRSKDGLRWRLAACAAALPAGGELWIAGQQREGIKSTTKLLEELFGATVTVHTKRRCRVLVARRRDAPCVAPTLNDEARTVAFEFKGQALKGITLPGVFAHGRLDDGTQRLLTWLASQKVKGRVLDLGAGAGLIGLACATLPRVSHVHMVDTAWIAVEAMKRTIAANADREITPIVTEHADVLTANSGPFDVVITNPPFHDGREEDRQLIARFARAAAQRLRPRGRFLAVCNTHLAYREPLSSHFARVEIAWEDNRYRVWSCVAPRP